MNESEYGRQPYDLSERDAAAIVEQQRALCEALFQAEITSFDELPEEIHEAAQLHLATCSQNHYPLSSDGSAG